MWYISMCTYTRVREGGSKCVSALFINGVWRSENFEMRLTSSDWNWKACSVYYNCRFCNCFFLRGWFFRVNNILRFRHFMQFSYLAEWILIKLHTYKHVRARSSFIWSDADRVLKRSHTWDYGDDSWCDLIYKKWGVREWYSLQQG